METGNVGRIGGKLCDEHRYITKIAKIAKLTKGQASFALERDDVSFVSLGRFAIFVIYRIAL
jgi:hypothetical protein